MDLSLVSSLAERQWLTLSDIGDQVSVMTYNILGDSVTPKRELGGADICGTYDFCPLEYLLRSNRHPRIIKEIETLKPDIVCMQEVESDHFDDNLQPDMEKLGYSAISHLRSYDHVGLAMFYNKSKLHLVDQEQFILHDRVKSMLVQHGIDTETAADVEKYMIEYGRYPEIPNIQPVGYLQGKFRLRSTGKLFCVSDIYVIYRELNYPVLQMLQVAVGLTETARFSNGDPYILVGDFNTTPGSSYYNFVTNGTLSDNDITRLENDDRLIDPNMTANGQKLIDIMKRVTLPHKMSSAYLSVQGREPRHTNTDERLPRDKDEVRVHLCCLDYMFYTSGVQSVAVLTDPDLQITRKNIGLPSEIYPSDHLPLMAGFKLET